MLALTIAFLLAVYSDVLAHEGNVLGTAVAGSLALALAGFVAVTAVPYLARRTSIGWLRGAIDYRLTREGSIFIASIFVLSIAALNTGNNMLFLIVASMLASILVSGIVSRMVLDGLELDVLLPDHVFARQPVLARVRLKNGKHLLPSFSVSVVGVSEPLRRRGGQRRGSPLDPVQNVLGPGVYFPYLRAGATGAQSIEVRFPRRGNYRQEQFGISTRFPFGFLEKILKLPARGELLVYPAIEPTEEFYEVLPLLSGELESYLRGRGHDLYTIRDYYPGDTARFVDWKASAHTGALMVREFTREDERRVQLVFDRALRGGPQSSERAAEQFERGVDFCAALAWHFHQIDSQLEFISDDFRTRSAPAGEVVFDVLRYLAMVQPRESQSDLLAALGDAGMFKIILTSAPPGSIPTHLWTSSYFVFLERL
jgi:uncharacterized protein (DUF58 family)